jgi:hypothetical protein
MQDHLAHLTLGHDSALALVLAALLALIAVSPWANDQRAVRAGLVLAMALGLVYWVCGQAFGMPFMGMATDPNSGPLLALLALVYWPTSVPAAAPQFAASVSAEGAAA